MGVSDFLSGAMFGVAGWEFARDAWRRMRASADAMQPVAPPKPQSIEDFMLESTKARAELTRIEHAVRQRIGAAEGSDAADSVMHAVRDGFGWDAVRKLERDRFCGRTSETNRLVNRI